jgi:hypothetical protein
LFDAIADARRAVCRADERDVRDRYRSFLVRDPALGSTPTALLDLLVTSDRVHALDDDAPLLRDDVQHAALCPEVLTGDDRDGVPLLDLESWHN